jgi:hypothetical protein
MPLPFHSDDDTCYYLVNGIRTHSKIHALELADGDFSKIHFYWLDDVWQRSDWTTEPAESMEVLLRNRCLQLRDKYNYLSLWYSSGYDSHTILTAFVKNNIRLDQVIIMDRRKTHDDPEVQFAIDHANLVKKQYQPWLDIWVVDVNPEYTLDFYKKYGEQWIYLPGNHAKFNKNSRFLRSISQDFNPNNNRQNRGEIQGTDKPRLMLRESKWYCFVPDDISYDLIGSRQENFYYTADMPELHIKQCWMAARWFETLPDLSEELVHEIQGKNIHSGKYIKHYQDWNLGFGRYPLRYSHDYSRTGEIKYLYMDVDEKNIESGKILSYSLLHDIKAFKTYHSGLQNIKKLNGNKANQTILSNQYYIKDLAH